jgi:RecA/RadA recombinase
MIKEMQARDPEGIAIYFNTELRGQLQYAAIPGIDTDRMIIYDTNDPVEIFDRVENDIKKMVQDGMPLRILAIDSLTGIQGVKRGNADSVANHLMGDQALTLQIGLGKLVPFCKRNNILLIGTSQMRANLDAGSHGPKEKMAAQWATKHAFEYFISFKKAGAAEDKQDISGKTFEDEEIKDARGNKLVNAHKVYMKMEASSIGQAGRAAVFTLSYDQGIINQHEEIFFLGKNNGIITTTNNRTFVYKDKSFNGKNQTAEAIKADPKMAQEIIEAVRKLDEK